jgi:hypothetical protein
MIIYKNINNKTMDNYRAVGLAEGFIETEDTDEIIRSLAVFTRYRVSL